MAKKNDKELVAAILTLACVSSNRNASGKSPGRIIELYRTMLEKLKRE